ncbi:homeodomain-like protein-related [Anaeramoeba flamelloides]|uniref:Homeodomain-like protein-related n=1 Tax=Anaeramoeba flamelloides TaxID=1746091 RepID=A0AAV7ZF78_9EUKA|nr:homeodomain-like protein-related [Anaeramoeba flamelloides]
MQYHNPVSFFETLFNLSNHNQTKSSQIIKNQKLLFKEIQILPTLSPVKHSKNSIWSTSEDEILARAVQKYQGKDWDLIAEYLLDKDPTQCLHRWKKVLNPELKKGPWTKEEDGLLKKTVKSYGDLNWKFISSHIPKRTSKQCRERWKNKLDPSINHSAWTKEEDEILIEKQAIYGNSWCKIKTYLPGRPDNMIKNRWNSTLKKQMEMGKYDQALKKQRGSKSKTKKNKKKKQTKKKTKSKLNRKRNRTNEKTKRKKKKEKQKNKKSTDKNLKKRKSLSEISHKEIQDLEKFIVRSESESVSGDGDGYGDGDGSGFGSEYEYKKVKKKKKRRRKNRRRRKVRLASSSSESNNECYQPEEKKKDNISFPKPKMKKKKKTKRKKSKTKQKLKQKIKQKQKTKSKQLARKKKKIKIKNLEKLKLTIKNSINQNTMNNNNLNNIKTNSVKLLKKTNLTPKQFPIIKNPKSILIQKEEKNDHQFPVSIISKHVIKNSNDTKPSQKKQFKVVKAKKNNNKNNKLFNISNNKSILSKECTHWKNNSHNNNSGIKQKINIQRFHSKNTDLIGKKIININNSNNVMNQSTLIQIKNELGNKNNDNDNNTGNNNNGDNSDNNNNNTYSNGSNSNIYNNDNDNELSYYADFFQFPDFPQIDEIKNQNIKYESNQLSKQTNMDKQEFETHIDPTIIDYKSNNNILLNKEEELNPFEELLSESELQKQPFLFEGLEYDYSSDTQDFPLDNNFQTTKKDIYPFETLLTMDNNNSNYFKNEFNGKLNFNQNQTDNTLI